MSLYFNESLILALAMRVDGRVERGVGDEILR